MSPQQIFDTVLKALRKQKIQSRGLSGRCLYRGVDGNKCAAGYLIPDDLYSFALEGKPTNSTAFLRQVPEFFSIHTNLILDLQVAHDLHMPKSIGRLDMWEKKMAQIAKEHKLIYIRPRDE